MFACMGFGRMPLHGKSSATESADSLPPLEPAEVICGTHVTDPITETETVTANTQDVAANSIVKNHIMASLGLGLVPAPLFDVSALTAVQLNLVRKLGAHYGVKVGERDLKTVLLALAGGVMPVVTVAGISSIAKLLPGIGTLAGSASLSLLAGAMTYALGQTFILHFEAGGTLEDFDPKLARAFFRRELEVGKRVVQDIRDEISGEKRARQRTLSS